MNNLSDIEFGMLLNSKSAQIEDSELRAILKEASDRLIYRGQLLDDAKAILDEAETILKQIQQE